MGEPVVLPNQGGPLILREAAHARTVSTSRLFPKTHRIRAARLAMPRTELGPAVCNRGRWNPADGNSPITKHDRLDARFRNATSKPPCEGPQTIGPETGVARSNLEPGESAFDDKPQFERGGFGAAVPPVCEGASCGSDASAKITGALTSFEYLNSRARSTLNLVATTVANAPLYFA